MLQGAEHRLGRLASLTKGAHDERSVDNCSSCAAAAPIARRVVIALAGLTIATVVAVFLATGGRQGAEPLDPRRIVELSTAGTQQFAAMATIMALTPARFAAGALDYGYALPQVQHGPTVAQVLASLSPSTRRYTKAVMSLSFAQLKAGAAGSP